MQDRYAGDIGDFGKFQLLRYCFNNTSYTFKQIWYKYPDESHNNDGLYINYFDKVKGFDASLEEAFKNLVQNHRSIKALQKCNLLKRATYFEDEISNDTLIFRQNWFQKALCFATNSDILAVDPDNGIATKVHKKNDGLKEIELLHTKDLKKRTKSGKYIFYDEIKALSAFCNTLIVYHHLNRTMAHNEQIKRIKGQLDLAFAKVLAIKHKPYSPRVYFFIFQNENNYEVLKKKLEVFESQFSSHWEYFE